MGDSETETMALPSAFLQSKEHADILNVIDDIRSLGMSHYMNLPQIIVCGEQSSGKSSVLNALSSIQFPQKDNLCTRFATEVILRRGPTNNITVSIVPGKDRTEVDKAVLAKFAQSGVKIGDIKDITARATKAIGIDYQSKNFSDDILRLEVTGPDQSQLTLVDLPGLFQAGNKNQTDEDAEAVKELVLSYMRRSRSIILAVVSAKNDLANQIVTRYARELDPEGHRTLGVITKPDTLPIGSESEASYLDVAKNRNIVLRHGWHVMKNRDYDTRLDTQEQRDAKEEEFFATGIWAALPRQHVGMASLKQRLSVLLRDQILQALPGLIRQVEDGVEDCKHLIAALGPARATVEEQKLYLLQASQQFSFIMRSAIDGSYTDDFFESAASEAGKQKRLRAVVQNTLIQFSHTMREKGHAKHVVTEHPRSKKRDGPVVITREDFIDEVLEVLKSTRGRELPGLFSPLLIGDLFFTQAMPWESMVKSLISDIWSSVGAMIDLLLSYTTDTTTTAGLKQIIIDPSLDELRSSLESMTSEVLSPHQKGHPITFNHYFTETVQKIRDGLKEKRLIPMLDSYFSTDIEHGKVRVSKDFSADALLKHLCGNRTADMDRFACSEAIDCMMSYYKTARKTLVDNLGTLVVENRLMKKLPDILSPFKISMLDDETITKVAAESEASAMERKQTQDKLDAFEKTLVLLARLDRGRQQDRGEHDESDNDGVSDTESTASDTESTKADEGTPAHPSEAPPRVTPRLVAEDPNPSPFFAFGTTTTKKKKSNKFSWD